MLGENLGVCMYGLCLGEQPAAGLDGVAGGKLEYFRFGEFWALVETGLDLGSLQNLKEESWIELALGYGRVQSHIFIKVKSMLPWSLRSAFFERMASLEQFLQAAEENFLTKLQGLEGWAEYSLVARFEQVEESFGEERLKGRAYFQLRKQEFERQQQIGLQAKVIVELVQAEVGRVGWEEPRLGEQLRASVLLRVEELTQTKERLRYWQGLNPGWKVELGEALPPYSFV